MTFIGRQPAVAPRKKPTGQPISFPVCADWTCDDDEDWEVVTADDEEYPQVKRERDIVYYHQPRSEWRQRLEDERRRLADGDPLWFGSRP